MREDRATGSPEPTEDTERALQNVLAIEKGKLALYEMGSQFSAAELKERLAEVIGPGILADGAQVLRTFDFNSLEEGIITKQIEDKPNTILVYVTLLSSAANDDKNNAFTDAAVSLWKRENDAEGRVRKTKKGFKITLTIEQFMELSAIHRFNPMPNYLRIMKKLGGIFRVHSRMPNNGGQKKTTAKAGDVNRYFAITE